MLESDVVVIGSGHAGIEAALASARLGCTTLVVTQNLDTIGQMSCNPAIGGSAKSHIVKEIDALGGAMGVNADATGLQFRRLNKSKGPAVWATRIQCDKKAYQFRLKALLERESKIQILQSTVTRVLEKNGCVIGVELDLGVTVKATSVVITAGTFLRGLLHVGERSMPGGRMSDSSSSLSDSLRQLGFTSARFKTGTPCRLNRQSINFSALEAQQGDDPAPRFSLHPVRRAADDVFTLNFDEDGMFHVEQIPCWLTHTTDKTTEIIRRNLHRSPLYKGRIEGIGPRYCPSIEDKIVRFPHRPAHHIFIEPEGRHSEEMYVNGTSTSLPFEVQVELIHSIPGLERAQILRPGYAVEYDFFPPTQLEPTLETRRIEGLFFAGQINGTSGYEEAAGQGLVAGANAALKSQARTRFILPPELSYIGVLIQDLTTRGVDEPYRMFTSRAENRLSLREDNADLRLTELGEADGLVNQQHAAAVREKKRLVDELKCASQSLRLKRKLLNVAMRDASFAVNQLPADVRRLAPDDIWEQVCADARYAGYIEHQQISRASFQNMRISEDLDFTAIPGLRNETREKLRKTRPGSIEAAQRIPGLTPTDIAILSIWLRKFQ